jgi:hypothetical protein
VAARPESRRRAVACAGRRDNGRRKPVPVAISVVVEPQPGPHRLPGASARFRVRARARSRTQDAPVAATVDERRCRWKRGAPVRAWRCGLATAVLRPTSIRELR